MFTTKPYPELCSYNHYMTIRGENICDDEALENLGEISRMRLKVGLQYSLSLN